MVNALFGMNSNNIIVKYLPRNYKERDASLDWARIIAAFLVIYGHLYSPEIKDPLRVFIYQFHMPFFFLISGMLHKYRNTLQIAKYAKALLLPFLAFQVISFFYNSLFYHFGWLGIHHECQSNNLLSTMGNYFTYAYKQYYFTPHFILKGNFLFNGPCWFLLALFYCKCFFDFFQRHKLLGLLFFVVLWFVFSYKNIACLFIGNFAMAFPFYLCGYYLKPMMEWLKITQYKWLVVMACLTIVVFCIMINGNVSTFGMVFGHMRYKILSIPFYYLTGMTGSIMLLSLSTWFKGSSKFSALCGNALISFLVFQSFFLLVVYNTIGSDNGYLESALIALSIFAGCMMAHLVTLKYTPFLIGKV